MAKLENGPQTLYFVYKNLNEDQGVANHSKILAAVMTDAEEAKKFYDLLNESQFELPSGKRPIEMSVVVVDGNIYYFPSDEYAPKKLIGERVEGVIKLKEHKGLPQEAVTETFEEAVALFADQLIKNKNVPYNSATAIRVDRYSARVYSLDYGYEIESSKIGLTPELATIAAEFGLGLSQ